MTKDSTSRHKDLSTFRVPIAGRSGSADLYQPRFRPAVLPPTIPHAVTGQDRLDSLAFDLTGEATAFWRLADLNRTYDATTLLEPGRTIRAPRRQP